MTNKEHVLLALSWLKKAQDQTKSGGVSAWYSLVTGWSHPYIETTGYIINTFLDCATQFPTSSKDLLARAEYMGDFLISQQLVNGGFRTATSAQQDPSPPTVFNTGQDLLGLSDLFKKTGKEKYRKAAIKAADFLCKIQEPDGSWIKNTYGSTVHTYHTRVAWGLLTVFEISGAKKYKEAAYKNLKWAASNQLPNGWFALNHLPSLNSDIPFTHTISYAIEGFWWSSLILQSPEFAMVAIKGAHPLAKYFLKKGRLPGSFDSNWQSTDTYSCLTGNAQLALMWWSMYRMTGNRIYKLAGKKMNEYLKSKQITSNILPAIQGSIGGSDPIYGDILPPRGYCRFAYLNWSTKFFIDALLEEEKNK
jgi:hypothetical protein